MPRLNDRREQSRVIVDRVEKIEHLGLLVHDVVGEKERERLGTLLLQEVEIAGRKETLISAVLNKRARVRLLGDVIHPDTSATYDDPQSHLRSFAAYSLVMMLKNAAPDGVEVLLGNHENGAFHGVFPDVARPSKHIGGVVVPLDDIFLNGLRAESWSTIKDRTGAVIPAGIGVADYLFSLYRETAQFLPLGSR